MVGRPWVDIVLSGAWRGSRSTSARPSSEQRSGNATFPPPGRHVRSADVECRSCSPRRVRARPRVCCTRRTEDRWRRPTSIPLILRQPRFPLSARSVSPSPGSQFSRVRQPVRRDRRRWRWRHASTRPRVRASSSGFSGTGSRTSHSTPPASSGVGPSATRPVPSVMILPLANRVRTRTTRALCCPRSWRAEASPATHRTATPPIA